jgi:trehalose-phosphatase
MDPQAEPMHALRARDFEAAVFDLDGVVTRTASVHAAAWKELFDAYLEQVSAGSNELFRAFDADEDYRRFVDGKPRYEGVRSFLESRGITLPYGDPEDPPERETICGLGNRKNALFHERLAKDGVEVFESSVKLIRTLRGRGLKTALVSSSKNAKAVGLDELVYAGSHGFDIAGPEGLSIQREQGADYLPALTRAHERLREALGGIEGVLIERKRFAIAVHFRQVAEVDVDRVEMAVDEVVERFPKLRKTYGKKIFELRPRIDWDKGKAVLWLLEALSLGGDDVLPLYLGDDVTDEDAYAALRDRGIGILVADSVCLTAARYVLRDPDEVARFLRRLIGMLKGGAP